jgi:hypothetical protein
MADRRYFVTVEVRPAPSQSDIQKFQGIFPETAMAGLGDQSGISLRAFTFEDSEAAARDHVLLGAQECFREPRYNVSVQSVSQE